MFKKKTKFNYLKHQMKMILILKIELINLHKNNGLFIHS